MKTNNILVLIVILSLISGAFASYVVLKVSSPSREELMEEWYLAETYVHVSPHGLRKHMSDGDDSFIVIDLRSQEEYEKEHIIGAISIPAYKDPDTSAYGDVERIVGEFNKLQEENPGKDLIVYCYSIPCMTGRKVGKMLAEEGIYVQHLGIGWNEWRYHWDTWNHEHEWDQTDVGDYISSGSEPGIPEVEKSPTLCLPGDFSC